MSQRPELNQELCDGCGLCVLVCKSGGLVMEKLRVKAVETIECDYCGDCESVCLNGAINLRYQIVRSVVA
jgi:MinD superfamily P-loop ATPase